LSQYFKVVGGFISPSHDSYVKSKMRSVAGTQKWCIPHREKLCKLALMDSDWISADLWEFNCSSFVDFFSVFQQLQNSLNESINVPVQLLYVCGEDHFVNCRLYSSNCEMPVIGIGRPGKVRLAKLKRWADKPEKLQFFTVGKLKDASSTRIRKRLMKGHQLNNQLVSEAVSEFLLHSGELSKWRKQVGIKFTDCAVKSDKVVSQLAAQPSLTVSSSKLQKSGSPPQEEQDAGAGILSRVGEGTQALIQEELKKPLDGSDLNNYEEALEELRRLRGLLSTIYRNDEEKKCDEAFSP